PDALPTFAAGAYLRQGAGRARRTGRARFRGKSRGMRHGICLSVHLLAILFQDLVGERRPCVQSPAAGKTEGSDVVQIDLRQNVAADDHVALSMSELDHRGVTIVDHGPQYVDELLR